MIQATDLRIGNYYLLNSRVIELDEELMYEIFTPYTGASLASLEPIPLSPEVLEACGFEKDRNGWHMSGTRFSLTDKFYPCWLDKMFWPQDIPDFKHLSLKYVHQLQNLFYFLSGGTELTINIEQVKV